MYNDYNMGMPNYMPIRSINWNNKSGDTNCLSNKAII